MVLTATTLLLYREPSKIGFTIPAGRFPDPQRPPRTTPDNNGSVSIRNNIIFTLFRKRLHKSASSVIFFPFFFFFLFFFSPSVCIQRGIYVSSNTFPGGPMLFPFFSSSFEPRKRFFFFLSPRGFFVSRALYLATMRILFTRHRVQCHRDKYEYCTRTPSFATIVYYNNIRFGQLLYLYNNKKNKKMYI